MKWSISSRENNSRSYRNCTLSPSKNHYFMSKSESSKTVWKKYYLATTVILVLLYIKSVNLHERKQPVGLICWLYEKFSVKSKVLACNYFFFCRPIYHHRCNNQTFIVGLNLEIYLTVYGYNNNTGHYFNKITNKPPVEVKILDYM